MAEQLAGISLEDDTEIWKIFLGNEHSILRDVESHRKHDPHKLLRRLEALVRNNSRSVNKDASQEEIQKYLERLVECYFGCSDSIKLSRSVEKLWQPYREVYEDWIKECFQKHLDSVIGREPMDTEALVRVSVLIEQNTMVQTVFADNLELYLSWTARKLTDLVKVPPTDLTKEETQCLYSVVKICLQVFQTCGSEICSRVWSENNFSHTGLSLATKDITESLIHILKTKGYSIDCVLLCGTATALILNTLPDPRQSYLTLDWILQNILNSDMEFDFYQLPSLNSSLIPTDLSAQLSKVTISGIGPLSLIRGCVSCGRKEVLTYQPSCTNKHIDEHSRNTLEEKLSIDHLHRESDTKTIFIKLFHYICRLCGGDITIHYHAFQLLLLWFSRLTKLISILESSIINSFTSICENTLQFVLLNMDSPVEDVPEAVIETFGLLLGTWNQFKEQGPDLPQIILKKIISTDWYVKGKYRLLSLLLKYMDSEKIIIDYPGIHAQLLQCLKTNHLTSAATSLYRAFLQEIQRQYRNAEKQAEVWKESWLPWVVRGLVAQDSPLRYNTSLHWIPATFKLLPSTSAILQQQLAVSMETPDCGICRTRLLHAWVVVTKAIRTLQGTADLTDSHVCEALYCQDESVRSEAIALICSSLKKAECLSDTEEKLLMECLPHNIKIDSAPFRQLLASNLKKLLVRLRDSSITMLKDSSANQLPLQRSVRFVDWLHKLCVDNLLPGACYQRRKGSLDLMHMIYDTLIYCPDSRQRKGYTPEAAGKLVNFAKSLGSWEFFTIENTKGLILCLLDGADEIQTSAADLLTRYFPCLPEDLACHLLIDSLILCSSSRSHESQSGALMCKYFFQKYIVEQRNQLTFHYDVVCGQYVTVKTDFKDDSGSQFLRCLIDEIDRCRLLAQENLVEASRKYPIHGLIRALGKCLTEVESIWQQHSSLLLSLTTHLVACCTQVIDGMLEVMASVAGQEACPSFAEIGMALENLLSQNQPDYSESTSLSPEYQYLLSYCWNNIKECCSFLGEVTGILNTKENQLEFNQIQSICDTFIKVLTKCRHKGVIEGTRLAFIHFCSSLITATEARLQHIPRTVLYQVLLSLKNNIMTSSVTRRSAGVPIIIQAILISEKKVKKTALLTKAVKELFEISSLPLDKDSGLTDLPQVHGLNILNSLFGDASLAASLMGHISQTVILVIEKFGSPSWAIRNAATRLFSTLITRIFGQRKGDDVSSNTVTFQELSSYYPELPPFIQDIIDEASQIVVEAIDQLDPRLFPVLTILSCLKPMDTADVSLNRTTSSIKDKLVKFIGSPVYQLRHLVASAMVAMVNMVDMAVVARECMTWIQGSSVKLCCNKVHGSLLIMNKLLDNIQSDSDLMGLWIKLMEQRRLVDMPCMIAGLYAKILNQLLQKYSGLTKEETVTDLLLLRLHQHSLEKSDIKDVGYPMLYTEAVHLLFTVWENTGRSCIPLAPVLLSRSNIEVRKACLDCMKKQIETDRLYHGGLLSLQQILIQQLKKETHIPNLAKILELILGLYLRCNQLDDGDALSGWLTENSLIMQKYTSLSAAALPISAIVVKLRIQCSDIKVAQELIQEFCGQIKKFSQDFNETKRTSVALALQTAGEFVLDLAADKQLPWIQNAAANLISACMTLLQDEDSDIRSQAASFVSGIKNISTHITFPSIHSNVCYELFLDYVARRFFLSREVCQLLAQQLYCPEDLAKIITDKKESRYQQLFDQEDNSFFAERLYNSLYIHKTLKVMVIPSSPAETHNESIHAFFNSLSISLENDLEVMISAIESINQDSLVSLLTDSTIFGSMCGLVLLLDIVTVAVGRDLKCRTKLDEIIKKECLPRQVQSALEKKITT